MKTIQRLVKVKIRLAPTVATYALVIAGCLLISFDVPHAYVFYVASCVVVMILNHKEIKEICASMLTTIKKIIHNKQKTER